MANAVLLRQCSTAAGIRSGTHKLSGSVGLLLVLFYGKVLLSCEGGGVELPGLFSGEKQQELKDEAPGMWGQEGYESFQSRLCRPKWNRGEEMEGREGQGQHREDER